MKYSLNELCDYFNCGRIVPFAMYKWNAGKEDRLVNILK